MKKYKLVIFDMDGVVVDIKSSWEYLHDKFMVNNKNNLNAYLKGDISYKDFMSKDINLWGKCHIDEITSLFKDVKLIDGIEVVVRKLKNKGYITILLSAGVSTLADSVNEIIGFNEVYSNILDIDKDGFLTGNGIPVVNFMKNIQF